MSDFGCRISGGSVLSLAKLAAVLKITRNPTSEIRNPSSEYAFPQGRKDEMHSEFGCPVSIVQRGLYLQHVERNHMPGVGQHFHDQMGFAESATTGDRCSHAWRLQWIDEVDVKRNMKSGGSIRRQPYRFGHYGPDTHLVDFPHRERMHARGVDQLALVDFAIGIVVDVPNADQRNMLRVNLRAEIEQVRQFSWSVAKTAGERHSVH